MKTDEMIEYYNMKIRDIDLKYFDTQDKEGIQIIGDFGDEKDT